MTLEEETAISHIKQLVKMGYLELGSKEVAYCLYETCFNSTDKARNIVNKMRYDK